MKANKILQCNFISRTVCPVLLQTTNNETNMVPGKWVPLGEAAITGTG